MDEVTIAVPIAVADQKTSQLRESSNFGGAAVPTLTFAATTRVGAAVPSRPWDAATQLRARGDTHPHLRPERSTKDKAASPEGAAALKCRERSLRVPVCAASQSRLSAGEFEPAG